MYNKHTFSTADSAHPESDKPQFKKPHNLNSLSLICPAHNHKKKWSSQNPDFIHKPISKIPPFHHQIKSKTLFPEFRNSWCKPPQKMESHFINKANHKTTKKPTPQIKNKKKVSGFQPRINRTEFEQMKNILYTYTPLHEFTIILIITKKTLLYWKTFCRAEWLMATLILNCLYICWKL